MHMYILRMLAAITATPSNIAVSSSVGEASLELRKSKFDVLEAILRASGGHHGDSWEVWGAILGPCRAILKLSWTILGHLGTICEPTLRILNHSEDICEPSWCHLDVILRLASTIYGHLGNIAKLTTCEA